MSSYIKMTKNQKPKTYTTTVVITPTPEHPCPVTGKPHFGNGKIHRCACDSCVAAGCSTENTQTHLIDSRSHKP